MGFLEGLLLRKKRFWLGLAVSLFFLFFFLRRTPFTELGQALRQANYFVLVAAALLYALPTLLRALRWRFLLGPLALVGVGRLSTVIVIGYTANNLLPVRLGELARAYVLGQKQGISKTSVLATVAVERVLDGLALLLFLFLVALFIPLAPWLERAAEVAAILFLGGLLLFFALASSEARSSKALSFLFRFLPRRWARPLEGLLGAFFQGLGVLRRPVPLGLAFLLSVLVWLGEALIAYLIAQAFSLDVPAYAFLASTAAANLAMSVPSSQGGIGPFEFFTAQSLLLFGAELVPATAYALALHAALMIPITLLGLFYLGAEGLSWRALTQAGARGDEPSLSAR